MKWLFYIFVLANAAFLTWNSVAGDKSTTQQEAVYAPPVSEKIRLLSEPPSEDEVAAEQAQAQDMEAALNQALANTSTSAAFCPRIEVEKNAEEAKLTGVLNELGWQYSEQTVVGKRPKYWLYIDAPATKARAAEIVKDLASKSIDSFIITREEMKNRISLGLYSAQGRAQQSQQRIEKTSGYTVNIYDHLRSVSLHQIDIKQSIDEDQWNAFLARFDLTKMMIKLEKNPC